MKDKHHKNHFHKKFAHKPSKPPTESNEVTKPATSLPIAQTENGTVKLSKQERRNLNKQKRLMESKLPAQDTKPAETTLTPNTSVYKRAPSFPKSYKLAIPVNDFIDNTHPEFEKILETSYEGFTFQQGSEFPVDYRNKFKQALLTLDEQGIYQFDYTQPAGLCTKVARTFVKRCLVGEPGMTYKYLGLRMFAHPWTPGSLGATEPMTSIRELNEELIRRSDALNDAIKGPEHGSSKYNLTLINRCFPEDEKIPLKMEPLFEKEKCAVSWHADSCLDHFSSIAIYHFDLSDQKDHPKPWKIAIRVTPNAEGPQQGKPAPPNVVSEAPPLRLTLPQEFCYYLLDDFNHHHQHTVIAGGSERFASTHRVSRREGHCYSYINQRCLSQLNEKILSDPKNIRRLFLLAEEVEFEWLRQYYIQGPKHHQLHEWWHEPMQKLIEYLQTIESRLTKVLLGLWLASQQDSDMKTHETVGHKELIKAHKLVEGITLESYDEFVSLFSDREEKRKGWLAREKDHIYHSCEADIRPMPLVLFDEKHPNPWISLITKNILPAKSEKNPSEIVKTINSWKANFMNKSSSSSK